MTATGVDHDLDIVNVRRSGLVTVQCRTHGVATTEEWEITSAAARDFRCDQGAGLRFITEYTGDDPADTYPRFCDLSGLSRGVHDNARDHAYGHVDQDRVIRAWQWHGDGRAEPLTITMAAVTESDDEDYYTQTWAVSYEGNRTLLSITVRIDGRV
jgi:hypothetical protein